MTIGIEPLLIQLSFTFLTFSPWNLAVWGGSCRWKLWVTSRYPRLSSGCRREDPGPALHRNDDLNDQDQEIYRCAADLEAQQWRPGAARHELEQRPLLVLAQPRHHLDQSEVSILVTVAPWPIRERYFSSPARTLRWSGGSARSRQRSWCGPKH